MNKREQLNKFLNRPVNTPAIEKPKEMPDQNSSETQVNTKHIRFADIENTFRKFNGQQNINQWINHFNEQAIVFKFNDLEKFVFAKKLLHENEALWVQHESEATTFVELIQELKDEYGPTQNCNNTRKIEATKETKR